jgi:hypothetical protein
MPVLIEAISIVVRRDAVDVKYPGGWEAFMGWVVNKTLCADANLARVGFMAPLDVRHFISELEAHGLTYLQDGRALDIAVIDQQSGFAAPCDWAEIGRIESNSVGGSVLACRFVGSSDDTFITPDRWIFEGSLSQKFTLVENGRVPEYLDFVRSEDGIQVYRDIRSGELVYIGRTS